MNNDLETLIEELMFDLHTRSCDSLSNPRGDGRRACDDHKDQLRAAFRSSIAQAATEARKGYEPKVMSRYRRRALTPQERSFESEVASFVKAYPDMTLHDYWVGRWHQKGNLGAAQLNPQKPITKEEK